MAEFDLGVGAATTADAIRQAGGTVLHEFNVPLIRARLPVSAVPDLVRHVGYAVETRPEDGLEFDGLIGLERRA